jgi:hypothetical protein
MSNPGKIADFDDVESRREHFSSILILILLPAAMKNNSGELQSFFISGVTGEPDLNLIKPVPPPAGSTSFFIFI